MQLQLHIFFLSYLSSLLVGPFLMEQVLFDVFITRFCAYSCSYRYLLPVSSCLFDPSYEPIRERLIAASPTGLSVPPSFQGLPCPISGVMVSLYIMPKHYATR